MRGKRVKSHGVLVTVVALLGASQVVAAGAVVTDISGQLEDGKTLTILGQGFGTKSPAAPLLYDTVDNQPAYDGVRDGDTIPTGSGLPWLINTTFNPDAVKYSTSNPRGVRRAHYTGAKKAYLQWPQALGYDRAPAGQRFLYVSWWYRPTGQRPSDIDVSMKLIRIWDDEGGTGTRISWTNQQMTWMEQGSGCPSDGGAAWQGWGGRLDAWNRNEIFVDSAQHTINSFVNSGYQQPSNTSCGGSFDITNFLKAPQFDHIGLSIKLIGNDPNIDPGNYAADFGEIYADVTPARVEIGDAPNWRDTVHREIQIPSSWDSSQIEVTVNQGSFSSLQDKWLYVVDADGSVNQIGFPLSSQATATPDPPINVQVQVR